MQPAVPCIIGSWCFKRQGNVFQTDGIRNFAVQCRGEEEVCNKYVVDIVAALYQGYPPETEMETSEITGM
jgi:hypothetical protein